MSTGTTKKRTPSKKKNNGGMATSTSAHKKSKSKSRSKSRHHKHAKKPGLQTNLSYGVALVLLASIAFLFYYTRYSKQQSLSFETTTQSTAEEHVLDLTHLNAKYVTMEAKYEHALAESATHLLDTQNDEKPQIPLLYKIDASKVRREWNHNVRDFVQGFEILSVHESGKLTVIESDGLYKQSTLKYIELDDDGTGKGHVASLPKVLQTVALAPQHFAEGCTLYTDKESGNKFIYQLTWRERKVLIYDLDLHKRKEMQMPPEMKEGWGLYYDDRTDVFLATDGSADIFYIHPKTFTVTKRLTVRYLNNDRDGSDHKVIGLSSLNEIEVVNGWIVANVWYNTNLYVISPYNGFVYAIIECWNIFPPEVRSKSHAVLNGIAFDRFNKHLVITGKNWPKIFAIDVPEYMYS